MKKFFLTIVFASLVQIGFAQQKASREDVYQVIEKSGANGQMNAAKSQIMGMIPKEKHAAFEAELDVILKKAMEKTVDVYLEEYSKDDIMAMIAFYNSPVGKKMTEKSEIIATKTQEAMGSLQSEIQMVLMKYME